MSASHEFNTPSERYTDASASGWLRIDCHPLSISANHVLEWCSKFGNVRSHRSLRPNSTDILVEVESMMIASHIVKAYTETPIVIDGQLVKFALVDAAFVRSHNWNQTPESDTARSAVPMHTDTDVKLSVASNTTDVTTTTTTDARDITPPLPEVAVAPSRILIVTVTNVSVPLTIDHLQRVFRPYGEVEKVILFSKNDASKALVQLSSVEAATLAMQELDGLDIFESCNRMNLAYSTRTEIQIKYNGPKSYDFTRRNDEENADTESAASVAANNVDASSKGVDGAPALQAHPQYASQPQPLPQSPQSSQSSRRVPRNTANSAGDSNVHSAKDTRKGARHGGSPTTSAETLQAAASVQGSNPGVNPDPDTIRTAHRRPHRQHGQNMQQPGVNGAAESFPTRGGPNATPYSPEQLVPVVPLPPGSPIHLMSRSPHRGPLYAPMVAATSAHYAHFGPAFSTYAHPYAQAHPAPMLAFPNGLPAGYALTVPTANVPGQPLQQPYLPSQQRGGNNTLPPGMNNPAARVAPSFSTPRTAAPADLTRPSGQSKLQCTVLVENLPPNYDCESTFILFGSFGDVKRVTMLADRRDSALVEFPNAQQAATSVLMLNNLLLRGQRLVVTTKIPEYLHELAESDLPKVVSQDDPTLSGTVESSTNPEQTKPVHPETKADSESKVESENDALEADLAALSALLERKGLPRSKHDAFMREPLSKDFSASLLHRFGNRITRQRNVHPPGPILHLSNLPPNVTKAELTQLILNALNSTVEKQEDADIVAAMQNLRTHYQKRAVVRSASGAIQGLEKDRCITICTQLARAATNVWGRPRAVPGELDGGLANATEVSAQNDVVPFEHGSRIYKINDIQVVNFQRDPRMAYAWLPSIEAAVHVLVKMHNYRLRRTYIRISFTNKQPDRLEEHPRHNHITTPYVAHLNAIPSHPYHPHQYPVPHDPMTLSAMHLALAQSQMGNVGHVVHSPPNTIFLGSFPGSRVAEPVGANRSELPTYADSESEQDNPVSVQPPQEVGKIESEHNKVSTSECE